MGGFDISNGVHLRGFAWVLAAAWTLVGYFAAGTFLGSAVYWTAVAAPLAVVAVLRSPLGGHVSSAFWTINIFGEWVEPTPVAILDHVLRLPQTEGNPAAVVDAIDTYCWTRAPLTMCVGDVKGKIVDAAFPKSRVKVAVELGAFFGYSSVRIGGLLGEGAVLYSVDPSALGHAVQAKLLARAGLTATVKPVFGYSSDHLRQMAADGQVIDFLLLDHVKDLYLADLQLALELGILRKGCIVVADNVRFPGAPEYKAWILAQKAFKTQVHETFVEYSTIIPDEVLVSEYLG